MSGRLLLPAFSVQHPLARDFIPTRHRIRAQLIQSLDLPLKGLALPCDLGEVVRLARSLPFHCGQLTLESFESLTAPREFCETLREGVLPRPDLLLKALCVRLHGASLTKDLLPLRQKPYALVELRLHSPNRVLNEGLPTPYSFLAFRHIQVAALQHEHLGRVAPARAGKPSPRRQGAFD